VLRRHCRFVEADDVIAPGSTLPELGMDSLEVVELIIDLEDCFDFSFPETLLTPEVFVGPSTIWEAIGPVITMAAEAARS